MEQVKEDLEQVKKEKELLYEDSLNATFVKMQKAKEELVQLEKKLELEANIKKKVLEEIISIEKKAQELKSKIEENEDASQQEQTEST